MLQQMRAVQRALFTVLLSLLLGGGVLSGCSDELDPTQPEGAYRIFRQGLLAGEADNVWECLDASTKGVFDERASTLTAMSDDIVRFLPTVDQKLARRQTGVEVLSTKGVSGGKSLFALLFVPGAVSVTPEIEVGMLVSSVELSTSKTEAIVVTQAGQQFRLAKEDDGHWRVSSWREFAVARTKWVLDNQTALQQTVEDLIAEEKEEVERIIDFLVKEHEAKSSPTE
jgi:hypothetical protein